MAKLKELSTVRIVDTQENSEFEYKTTAEPKKSTLGNSVFGTMNAHGFNEIQSKDFQQEQMKNAVAKFWNKLNSGEYVGVYDEHDYCNLIREVLGLSESSIGDRGPRWDTLEARQRYKVFLNDTPFEPEFTAKQKAKMEEELSAPSVPKTLGMATIPTATADTTQIMTPQIPTTIVPQPIVPQIPQVPTATTPQTPQQPQVPSFVPEPIFKPTVQDIAYASKMELWLKQGYTKEQLIGSLAKQVGEERANNIYGLVNQ